MPKTIIQAGHSTGSQISSSGSFWAPGTTLIADSATEENREIRMRSAGTLSNFTIYLGSNATTGTSTFVVRVNGVDGNQTISVSTGQTGEFTDSSNTDSISAGDDISFEGTAASAGSMLATIMQVMFAAGSNTVSKQVALTGRAAIADTSSYVFGMNQGSTTHGTVGGGYEGFVKSRVRKAGTAKNLGCHVSANSVASTSTLRLRVNTANGNLAVSITASTTGTFEDTSNSDSISAGDDINFHHTNGGSGSITVDVMYVEYETADSSGFIYNEDDGANGGSAGTTSWTLSGGTAYNGSEFVNHVDNLNEAYTFSNLTFNVFSNTNGTGTVTITLRKNEADTAITVSIGAGQTGLFEDTTNTVDFTSTDEPNFRYSSGGDGLITWFYTGIHYTGPAVAVTDEERYMAVNTIPNLVFPPWMTDLLNKIVGIRTNTKTIPLHRLYTELEAAFIKFSNLSYTFINKWNYLSSSFLSRLCKTKSNYIDHYIAYHTLMTNKKWSYFNK